MHKIAHIPESGRTHLSSHLRQIGDICEKAGEECLLAFSQTNEDSVLLAHLQWVTLGDAVKHYVQEVTLDEWAMISHLLRDLASECLRQRLNDKWTTLCALQGTIEGVLATINCNVNTHDLAIQFWMQDTEAIHN